MKNLEIQENIKIEKWSRNEQRWIVMSQDWMKMKAEVQIYNFQLTKKKYIYIYNYIKMKIIYKNRFLNIYNFFVNWKM